MNAKEYMDAFGGEIPPSMRKAAALRSLSLLEKVLSLPPYQHGPTHVDGIERKFEVNQEWINEMRSQIVHDNSYQLQRKQLNGKEIRYADVIHHGTVTTFSFMDRLRILFGKKFHSFSRLYVLTEMNYRIHSETDCHVDPIFKKKEKLQGMEHNYIKVHNCPKCKHVFPFHPTHLSDGTVLNKEQRRNVVPVMTVMVTEGGWVERKCSCGGQLHLKITDLEMKYWDPTTWMVGFTITDEKDLREVPPGGFMAEKKEGAV